MRMVTGPQLYWITKVDLIPISDEEARSADGLWKGLEEVERTNYTRAAGIINNLNTKALKDCEDIVREFKWRVEAGEIGSRRTYAQCVNAVAKLDKEKDS